MPKDQNSRRRNLDQDDDDLIEMNPETLALAIFNFRLDNDDGEMESKGIAGIRIKQWTDENIKFKIDFADPLDVSSGYELDKL